MGDSELWIVIPNWDKFQHRDVVRSENAPPWIKVYTRLLSDDDYLDLSLSQRGILHGIWLLYARHRRTLSEATTRRLLTTNKTEARHWRSNLAALNDAGFITLSASRPPAGCQQDASLDKEEIRTPPTPPTGGTENGSRSKPRPRRSEPTYEDLNPYVCGIDGCTVRHPTEERIREHRENVHSTTPAFVPAGAAPDEPYDDIPF